MALTRLRHWVSRKSDPQIPRNKIHILSSDPSEAGLSADSDLRLCFDARPVRGASVANFGHSERAVEARLWRPS